MTVKDLIEILKKYNPEQKIISRYYDTEEGRVSDCSDLDIFEDEGNVVVEV